MAFKMRGFSPFKDEGKQTPKDPSRDPRWIDREIARLKEMGLDWKHLTKYMTEAQKIKYLK